MKKLTAPARYLCISALQLIIPGILALALLFTDVWYLESGSMSPAYPAGSIIVTSRLIKPHLGSVCAYKHNGITIVHRIISVDSDGFILKGDANNTSDPLPVKADEIDGVMLFGIRPVT